MDSRTNICPALTTPDNPLFFITSRAPAHVHQATTPQEAYDWLYARLVEFADDPERALDFEIVDLARS